MKMPFRLFATLIVSVWPTTGFPQSTPAPAEKWALGLGAALIDSPYAGEGSRVRAFPLISYEGERIFLRGISGGVHLYQSQQVTLDVILSARLQGFDIDDLGYSELLINGVDANLLSDRDDGLDAGFRATFASSWGSISLEAIHDISNASDGYEISFDYRYRWSFDKTVVVANAGASQMSAHLADYYFGILGEEIERGVTAYSPGSVVVPRIGLTVTYPVQSMKWQLLGSVGYQFLPNELRDSPLLEPDSDGFGRAVLGLSRRF